MLPPGGGVEPGVGVGFGPGVAVGLGRGVGAGVGMFVIGIWMGWRGAGVGLALGVLGSSVIVWQPRMATAVQMAAIEVLPVISKPSEKTSVS
jgi:hypothetical protein